MFSFSDKAETSRGLVIARRKAAEWAAVCAMLTFAYFFRNLSTRPSVSMSFCLPVKKGWQTEQMSSLMFSLVDLVWNFSPQAQ